MRKLRNFQENSMQNLQFQQQFDQLIQIKGLSFTNQPSKDPFPSVKSLFHASTSLNIIGQGPNANIRAFYYLLLCHIRKQHLSKLVNQQKLKEASQTGQYDAGRRDRKVSFNSKATVFLNGPQHENYALHKLRIYAFSSASDLLSITNTPFQNQPILRFKGRHLTSHQLKKLLSQFLKELLPKQLPKNYKQSLKSVRFHLNKHKVAGIVLTIVMRYILFCNYNLQSAVDFQSQLNDHTVCTTLCDAFAIDGLLCKQDLFQINNWCKIYSINFSKGKQLFVEVLNDQFQELGLRNDKKTGLSRSPQAPPYLGYSQSRKQSGVIQSSEQQYNSKEYNSPSFKAQLQSNYDKSCSSSLNKQNESSSLMEADQDSQISCGTQLEKEGKNYLRDTESNQQTPVKDAFRQTFNSNRKAIQASVLQAIKDQQIEAQSSQLKKESNQVEKQSQPKVFISEIKQQDLMSSSVSCYNLTNSYLNETVKEVSQEDQMRCLNIRSTLDTQEDCSSAKSMQKLHFPKEQTIQVKKMRNQPDQHQYISIVNNKINNNIYVALNDGANKSYTPVIKITKAKNDQNLINIKLS